MKVKVKGKAEATGRLKGHLCAISDISDMCKVDEVVSDRVRRRENSDITVCMRQVSKGIDDYVRNLLRSVHLPR